MLTQTAEQTQPLEPCHHRHQRKEQPQGAAVDIIQIGPSGGTRKAVAAASSQAMDSTVSRRKNTMSFCNTHLSIREDMLAQTGGKIKENIFVGERLEDIELPYVSTLEDREIGKPPSQNGLEAC